MLTILSKNLIQELKKMDKILLIYLLSKLYVEYWAMRICYLLYYVLLFEFSLSMEGIY